MSNSSNPLEHAKQGNPRAIAYLINQQLRTKGITAKVERQASSLYIELESLDEVAQDSVFPVIENGIRRLGIPGLESLTVVAKLSGSTETLWQEDIIFDREVLDFDEVDEAQAPPVPPSYPISGSQDTNRLVNPPQDMKSVKGKVLDFSIQSNSGLISGNDGRRYKFIGASWKLERSPSQGMAVEFEVDSNGYAILIYPDLETQSSIIRTLSRTTTSLSNSSNEPVDQTKALIYFFLCMPLGFAQWGQSSKGWLWVLASMLTVGWAGIAAIVDYWMCFSAQQKRSLGEWDIFPKS